MRRLSLILIVTGVLVLLYPLLDRAYTWYWQQKIFNEWEAEHMREDTHVEKDTVKERVETEAGLEENENNINPAESSEAEGSENDTILRNTLGILEIEKINLKLPILGGTSEAILRIGAGLLEGTAGFGEVGNTVLTAHRSHTYGRFFNRLDELEAGDRITISTEHDQQYHYVVYRTIIVEVDDTSIFEFEEGDRILTLYTCHPLYSVNPVNRLIVQARLE
jgi:sortase A